MKTIVTIVFVSMMLFVSCSSAKTEQSSKNANYTSGTQTNSNLKISDETFDILQRPLGFNLQENMQPISRKAWEYHMLGINWWDIYLLMGKKMGNGIYENKSRIDVFETHSVKDIDKRNYKVNRVEIIWFSNHLDEINSLREQFIKEANYLFGEPEKTNDGSTAWKAGWFLYTAYPIQQHEDGNYILLVSAFDVSD